MAASEGCTAQYVLGQWDTRGDRTGIAFDLGLCQLGYDQRRLGLRDGEDLCRLFISPPWGGLMKIWHHHSNFYGTRDPSDTTPAVKKTEGAVFRSPEATAAEVCAWRVPPSQQDSCFCLKMQS